jgi:hypothetical protein
MRKGCLFNRKKRSHFISAGTDYTDGAGDYEKNEIARAREGYAGGSHKHRADDQHAPPPDAIRSRREI